MSANKVQVTSGGLRGGLSERPRRDVQGCVGVRRRALKRRSQPQELLTASDAAETVLASVEGRKKVFSQRDVAICAGSAEYTIREQFVEIFKPREWIP